MAKSPLTATEIAMNMPMSDPASVWNQRIAEAYQAGLRQGERDISGRVEQLEKTIMRPAPTYQPGMIDNLKELVTYGDIIIRKVGNGYIIRHVPGDMDRNYASHGVIETLVVEGDISEVAKELNAMKAREETERSAKLARVETLSDSLAGSAVPGAGTFTSAIAGPTTPDPFRKYAKGLLAP